MSTVFDISDWHPERIAGFVEAIRGDHPSVEIQAVICHRDADQVGQLSMSLTDKPASDFTARRCETCQTVTVSKIIPLASLKGYKTLSAAGETDSEPERTHDHHDHRNGNGQH
jgi:hypothetical protein